MLAFIEGPKKLSEEQLAKARAFFAFNDSNQDGFITLEEAKSFAASTGKAFDEKA